MGKKTYLLTIFHWFIVLIQAMFEKLEDLAQNNKKISSQNNVANFISEIDSNLVNDVSDNEFFLFEKNAYVIDKQKYKFYFWWLCFWKIYLNSLNC